MPLFERLHIVAQLAIAPVREAPFTFSLVGIVGLVLLLPLTWGAFWLAGQIVVRVPMYQYVPATVFWRGVTLLPCLSMGALIGVAMGSRAMSGALAVCAAMAVYAAVIIPMLLMATMPPARVPGALDYLTRTLPVFSMFKAVRLQPRPMELLYSYTHSLADPEMRMAVI